jgi:hypothetical protein
MEMKRRIHTTGPMVRLSTDSETVVRHEAYAKHVWGVASRFGRTDGTYSLYSLGDGFNEQDAIEAAFAGVLDYFEALGQDVYEEFGETEDSEPAYIFHVDGVGFEFDIDAMFMPVRVK